MAKGTFERGGRTFHWVTKGDKQPTITVRSPGLTEKTTQVGENEPEDVADILAHEMLGEEE